MIDHHPKISVCIPAYNCSGYLKQTLESVLHQSLQDFEIIVYDDASTDDTPQVVAAVRNRRARYFRNCRNLGVAATRNHCLNVARGKYIAWLDADDRYHSDMLATHSAILDCYPNVGLVHGAYHVIDEEGRRLPEWPPPFSSDEIENGREAFRELILSNYITTPTVMVRRECHDRVGPFSETIGKSSTDWDMWLRIALHADLAFTSKAVAQYRQRHSSLSASTRKGERLHCDIRVVQRMLPMARHLIPDFETLQRQARAALAAKALLHDNDAFTRGERAEALRAVMAGFRMAGALMNSPQSLRLLAAIVAGDEYAHFRCNRRLLQQLHTHLVATRFGRRLQKQTEDNTAWQETQESIAQIMQQHVPKKARVLIVDKWDPTLFHLSRRKGWNFPERSLMPEGYPANDEKAVAHLNQLRKRGANFLVFPHAAFWWLDYYRAFRQHLETEHACIWKDERCVIYEIL
jgi:glycosyltransferase involved in cell wall biosynthesis